MTAVEWLIIVALAALVLFALAGVIDAQAHSGERQRSRIDRPVQAHTPLPPTRQPNAVTWARADHVPPGPGRHRRPGGPR